MLIQAPGLNSVESVRPSRRLRLRSSQEIRLNIIRGFAFCVGSKVLWLLSECLAGGNSLNTLKCLNGMLREVYNAKRVKKG